MRPGQRESFLVTVPLSPDGGETFKPSFLFSPPPSHASLVLRARRRGGER